MACTATAKAAAKTSRIVREIRSTHGESGGVGGGRCSGHYGACTF